MSDYSRTLSELTKLTEETATSRPVARALVKKSTIDLVAHQALLHATAPNGVVTSYGDNARADDGEPPGTPQNVEVVPLTHGLAVSWDMPPAEDRVKLAKIRVTPIPGSPVIYDSTTLIDTPVMNLDPELSYTVEVSFIDAYSAQGGWCAPITEQPNRLVAEEVDLEGLSLLERLQGLLPNANLATIEDATKLGSGVVTAQAMAVQDAVAINLWVQNAAIQSAKIAQLSADKITTGTLIAADILLSSTGTIKAGDHTRLDAGGITLGLHTSFDTSTAAQSYKVSGEGGIGSLMFFAENPESSAGYDARGAILRADGDIADLPGTVHLLATYNGDLHDVRTASVQVQAGIPGFVGAVFTTGRFVPLNGIDMSRSRPGLIGQGGITSSVVTSGSLFAFPHTFGTAPGTVLINVSLDKVQWRPVTDSTNWSIVITSTQVVVQNNSGSSYFIRANIMG